MAHGHVRLRHCDVRVCVGISPLSVDPGLNYAETPIIVRQLFFVGSGPSFSICLPCDDPPMAGNLPIKTLVDSKYFCVLIVCVYISWMDVCVSRECMTLNFSSRLNWMVPCLYPGIRPGRRMAFFSA